MAAVSTDGNGNVWAVVEATGAVTVSEVPALQGWSEHTQTAAVTVTVKGA